MPLKDMTDFEWDTVYAFFPYASGTDIDSVSGTEAVDRGLRLGEFQDLLVFTVRGHLAKVELLDDILSWNRQPKWDIDVTLVGARYCGFVLTDSRSRAIPDGCN
jgi:hypothetical protein